MSSDTGIRSAEEACAMVAVRSSDVIISVQPNLSEDSAFSSVLTRLCTAECGVHLTKVRQNADPLILALKPARDGRFVTVTTSSSVLVPAVAHLYSLASYPVVLHVALQSAESSVPDYASVTAVRNSGWIFIHSESLVEAQDMALTAHALARASGRGVMHFFDSTASLEDKPIGQEDVDILHHALLSPPPDDIATQETEVDPATPNTAILDTVSRIWTVIESQTSRRYTPFQYTGPPNAENCLFIFGSNADLLGEAIDAADSTDVSASTGIITVRLYRPWIGACLLEALPKTIKRVAVLEQVIRKTTKWGPLLIDVLSSAKAGPGGVQIFVGHQLGRITSETATQALRGVIQNLVSKKPVQNLRVGSVEASLALGPNVDVPVLESAYTKILAQLFGTRAYIANGLATQETAGVTASVSASPEFGLGSLLARKEQRASLISEVKGAVASLHTEEAKENAARWSAVATEPSKVGDVADSFITSLGSDGSPAATTLLRKQHFFRRESLWLLGSDAWAYDVGDSAVHHLLASGEDVNMLIIDSTPYSERKSHVTRRKKDIGLYAMNFGNAYVASVAVYGSYTQVLQAMLEADAFAGPSIVLAYLPYFGETDSPITVLQETKKAVEVGYWPLYRWNPVNEETSGQSNFALDSQCIKNELQQFLKRDNRLTQLMRRKPNFTSSLPEDRGAVVRNRQRRNAKNAFKELQDGLFGAPLTILFASDNGNAQSVAQRLWRRGRSRGLRTTVVAMEDYPVEDLPVEENLVLVTSTAGQGEFPQNGKPFWDAVKENTGLDLAAVRYAVFGLGDSHYWPRKEDKIYYNKPAKDLDRVLATLGAKKLAELGLGDDQDPDGYQTGYQEWEALLWEALGVDKVELSAEEPPPITNEDIKLASNYLRGTIQEGLLDESTGAISASDQQLTKFHGTYMQDDRDIRDERKAQGLEPAYSFMIRCRLPGGVATPQQWVQMDDIATELGNHTMKLTTRQTFQFHGVVKGKLRPAMRAINRALMTTIAACGDVNRNVMCSPLPSNSGFHREVHECCRRISDHLLPSTTAYHEIWLMDEDNKNTQVAGNAVQDFEPLYGPTYLPRKFKITIAVPPHNDTDVYAHDIGLIAIKGPDGQLEGFNLLAGGGMGVTHNNTKTYPQIGRSLGFVTPDQVHIACEKVMLVQRDFGDRGNRKHARLKYTIDDMGVDEFRGKVQELWGRDFGPGREYKFESNLDTFGWQRDEIGMNHFTFFIENGRVEDSASLQAKTGLREIAMVHKGEFRLTGNQHLILSNVSDEELPRIKELLSKYGLDNVQFSALRLSSSACVAFPTCGLAMAESERYLPILVSKLEQCLEEQGLSRDSIVMRMTGCPNGCARPWVAEVAFVGKAYGAYNMYLGGGFHGERLNKLYRASIKEDEILTIMKALLRRYAHERHDSEHFGDFCIRVGIIHATREGRDFHEGVVDPDDEE